MSEQIPIAYIEVRFVDLAGETRYREQVRTLPHDPTLGVTNISKAHTRVLAEHDEEGAIKVKHDWTYDSWVGKER